MKWNQLKPTLGMGPQVGSAGRNLNGTAGRKRAALGDQRGPVIAVPVFILNVKRSNIKYQISNIRYQISNQQPQIKISNIKYQNENIKMSRCQNIKMKIVSKISKISNIKYENQM